MNTELIARQTAVAQAEEVAVLTAERDALQAQLAAARAEVERVNIYNSHLRSYNSSLQAQQRIVADAAPIPQQPSVPEGWKQAVALAYGHLWHVNNEPMAPIPLRSSETAAYEARKQLRDLLTHEERGLAINRVQAMLSAAPQPKEKQCQPIDSMKCQ